MMRAYEGWQYVKELWWECLDSRAVGRGVLVQGLES
jgi:hypothetical protein